MVTTMIKTDELELERERGERRRHGWRNGGLVLLALGAAGLGLGAVTALDGTEAERSLGLVIALVGGAAAIVGALVAWRGRRQAEPAGPDTGYRDRVQRQRRSQMVMMTVLMLAAVAIGVPAVMRILSGEGSGADWVWAGAIAVHALTAPMMLMGWDGEARKQKRMLDDEFSRALRGRALALGYVVLTGGVLVVFGIGLWRPELAVTVLPVAIFAAGAASLWRFVWLDREADRLG